MTTVDIEHAVIRGRQMLEDHLFVTRKTADEALELLGKISDLLISIQGYQSTAKWVADTYLAEKSSHTTFSEKQKQCRADGTLFEVEDNLMPDRVVMACHKYKTACCSDVCKKERGDGAHGCTFTGDCDFQRPRRAR